MLQKRFPQKQADLIKKTVQSYILSILAKISSFSCVFMLYILARLQGHFEENCNRNILIFNKN